MTGQRAASPSPLMCSVKPAHYLAIGDSFFHSGCAVIEIVFPNLKPMDVGKITFVNNYTATLTVKMKVRSCQLVFKPTVLLRPLIFPQYVALLWQTLHCRHAHQHFERLCFIDHVVVGFILWLMVISECESQLTATSRA